MTEPAATAVPRFARGVRLHHDSARDRWVLLAPERVLQPDAIALAILQQADGRRSLQDIVLELAARYAADLERIERDVRTLLQDLADKGVVTWQP